METADIKKYKIVYPSIIAIGLSIISIGLSVIRTTPFVFENTAFYGWIMTILSLFVTILITWQIYKVALFDSKVNKKIRDAVSLLKEENSIEINKSSCLEYLRLASILSEQLGYNPDSVISYLSLAANTALRIEDQTVLNKLFDDIETAYKKEIFRKAYSQKTFDDFYTQLKKLLGKNDRVYDLVKKIEEIKIKENIII
jgi:hypothetical protein